MAELLSDVEFKKLHPASNAYKEQKILRAQQENGEQKPPTPPTMMPQSSTEKPQHFSRDDDADQKFQASQMTGAQSGFGPQANNVSDNVIKAVPEKEWLVFPDKVILKPIQSQKFRLGLENTKEKFVRLPGTLYKWEPSLVGNNYKTGLHFVSPETKKELEAGVGKELNFDYYVELTYRMDGSNPHGHHMDLSREREKIVYLCMLDSHLIARTLSEKLDGRKPEAEWYMENLEAEAEMLAKEKDVFTKVFASYSNLSQQKMVAVCKILGISVRGVSPKVAENYLYAKLMDKSTGYQKVWDKFLSVCTWSEEKINVYEEVEDAISMNFLRRNAAQDFVYGDEILGSTKEQVISKLLQPENGALRVSIKAKIYAR